MFHLDLHLNIWLCKCGKYCPTAQELHQCCRINTDIASPCVPLPLPWLPACCSIHHGDGNLMWMTMHGTHLPGKILKSAPLVLAAMVASRPTCEKITKRQLPASTPTSLLATCSAYRCLCVLFNLCSIDRPHAASIPISYGRQVIDFIRIRSCSLWEGKLVWSYEVSAGSQGKPSTVWLWN